MPVKNHRFSPATRAIRAAGVLATWASLLSPAFADASIIETTGSLAVGDFDGDGDREFAVGSPETECAKGTVYVVSLSPASSVAWTRDTAGVLGVAACNDTFGASVVVGDYNGDGRDDLAISAPGAADAGAATTGTVHVLYGSATGLTEVGDQLWHQDSVGIQGVAEANDYFGDALSTGDFNCDGFDDLVIGVPREALTATSTNDEGAVHVFYGSAAGVSAVDDLWYQGSAGVDDVAELKDRFGASLARGNFNGDANAGKACDDLVIGAPYEGVGSVAAAGLIYLIDGSAAGLSTTGDQSFHQNSASVVDVSETNDLFGWRVRAGRINADAYDDLMVDVPGDGCGSAPGVGRHRFYGSAGGLVTTNNSLACDLFACENPGGSTLACPSVTDRVYGLAGADRLGFADGHDSAWAGAGADVSFGRGGHDVLFGGAGDDIFDGGPGRDVLIGGAGNDLFVINATCEVGAGEVIDGGTGNDKIRSHLTQSQLIGQGARLVSIESFETVLADPLGDETCAAGPRDDGPLVEPRVKLSYAALPLASSTYSTTTGSLALTCANTSPDAVQVALTFTLFARGTKTEIVRTPFTVAANGSTTHSLALTDFIPSGVHTSALPPALLVLPTSATLTVRADLTVGAKSAGASVGPKVYGHLQPGPGSGQTAVLYRDAALRDIYNDGDLAAWRKGGPYDSGPGIRLGRIEAVGPAGIPGY
jgi:Ca2+-binding RTX toxin-like protein